MKLKLARCLYACLVTMAMMMPRPATALDASGSMEFVCIPPLGLDIHLEGYKHGETLLMHLWASPTSTLRTKKPLSATAIWCTAPDKCEPGKATVAFKHLNLEKRASGTYELQFPDGRRDHGAFSVVKRKQPKPFLCQ